MSDVIIDTNVMVVANRQNAQVTTDCQDACIQFLIEARDRHRILLDDGDEIRAEYAKALQQSRPYQLGAQFLIHIYQQQANSGRVKRVDLPKTVAGGFADFPDDPALAEFDLSDRKFAALARKTGTSVTNATDSDWADHRPALAANGIAVIFLCGCDIGAWFER